MKPYIVLNNAAVEIPIFGVDDLSLRRRLLGRSRTPTVVRALHDLNLVISSGDRVGLYGHNGAGKTTLLRCLSGGYQPSKGNLEMVGTVNSLIDINLGLEVEASGLQNIRLKLTLMQVPASLHKDFTDRIVKFADLGEFISLPLRTYSSGMAMRLAFSIATSVPSDILLLDEWLSVGDESFALKASTRMKQLTSDASIMVIASHSIDLLKSTCTRLVHLQNGTIVKEEKIS